TYHVVSGKVMSSAVKSGPVKTVQGGSARLNARGGKVMIDKATVTKADIEADNGVIHVIDTVIMPSKGKM
ncbi:MAG: fasciclin domain-containing protein, partial [Bryobacteraceae bacterium]|nr:fasciclin domain-containing protein [Bryobacteraceae bacterium]